MNKQVRDKRAFKSDPVSRHLVEGWGFNGRFSVATDVGRRVLDHNPDNVERLCDH